MTRLRPLVMLLVASTYSPTHAAHYDTPWRPDSLHVADGGWQLHVGPPPAVRHIHLPGERAALATLSTSERQVAEEQITAHDANLATIESAAKTFAERLLRGKTRLHPEYRRDLSQVLVAAGRGTSGGVVSLRDHEPVLKALPDYSRVIVYAPRAEQRLVREQLRRLGLSRRATVLDDIDAGPNVKLSPWIRDKLLVVDEDKRAILATPMRFAPGPHLQASDLRHLDQLANPQREILRTPLFYRSGNLLLGIGRQRVLLVGEGELFFNATGYVQAHLPRPPTDSVLAALQTLSGAEQVVVLPNTDRFFHIDQYLAPLADGVAALLAPLDRERLAPEERQVLDEARRTLAALGFRIVPIPTVADRVHAYQSPVNIVPFQDRRSGRRSALVPTFPDRQVLVSGQATSLNALVRKAYTAAGIHPIEVEDRFAALGGNTHCVVVALH